MAAAVDSDLSVVVAPSAGQWMRADGQARRSERVSVVAGPRLEYAVAESAACRRALRGAGDPGREGRHGRSRDRDNGSLRSAPRSGPHQAEGRQPDVLGAGTGRRIPQSLRPRGSGERPRHVVLVGLRFRPRQRRRGKRDVWPHFLAALPWGSVDHRNGGADPGLTRLCRGGRPHSSRVSARVRQRRRPCRRLRPVSIGRRSTPPWPSSRTALDANRKSPRQGGGLFYSVSEACASAIVKRRGEQ